MANLLLLIPNPDVCKTYRYTSFFFAFLQRETTFLTSCLLPWINWPFSQLKVFAPSSLKNWPLFEKGGKNVNGRVASSVTMTDA